MKDSFFNLNTPRPMVRALPIHYSNSEGNTLSEIIHQISTKAEKLNLACEGYRLSHSYANTDLSEDWKDEGVHQQQYYISGLRELLAELCALRHSFILQVKDMPRRTVS